MHSGVEGEILGVVAIDEHKPFSHDGPGLSNRLEKL